ncbi:MAG: Hsp20/alpha crystallin family protein [Cyanobacteria bacterium REEB65]|nr:Hsp20/alpha crystallin family protein [Cyanobacteria bacterium REEB65]
MSLLPWRPLQDLDRMREQMERTLDRLMPRVTWAPRSFEETPGVLLPDVDVYRTEDEVVIRVDLPGMRPEEVSVEATPDTVCLSGETKQESEYQGASIYRAERQYGSFCRSIQLPEKIQDQKVKATFENGVLTVRAPLAEEAKRERRKIPVETSK